MKTEFSLEEAARSHRKLLVFYRKPGGNIKVVSAEARRNPEMMHSIDFEKPVAAFFCFLCVAKVSKPATDFGKSCPDGKCADVACLEQPEARPSKLRIVFLF